MDKSVKCNYCDKTFAIKKYLQAHIQRTHKAENGEKLSKSNYQ